MSKLREEDIVQVLRNYSDSYLTKKAQYAVFIDGKHCFIGKAKVYMTYGKARGKIIDLFKFHYSMKREDIGKMVDDLIERKVIEIKQIL